MKIGMMHDIGENQFMVLYSLLYGSKCAWHSGGILSVFHARLQYSLHGEWTIGW